MGHIDRIVEEKRTEILQCRNMIYEIQGKDLLSAYDKDRLEVLKSMVIRLEDEINHIHRY